MKYRRLAVLLVLGSFGVSVVGVAICAMRHRAGAYAYGLSLPAGRLGDKPRVFLSFTLLTGRGPWIGAVQGTWNGRPFRSPAGLNLPLDSAWGGDLSEFGIDLPPFEDGVSKVEVTGLFVYSHDGRALKFPGRLSAETKAVPRGTDFLLELEAASNGLRDSKPILASCAKLVGAEEPWGEAQWAEATTMLRGYSRAIEGTLQAGRLYPYHSVLDLEAFGEVGTGWRTLGCLSLLLGRAEEHSGETEAAVQTYLDTMRSGLNVALSDETIWALRIGRSIVEPAAAVIGSLAAGGTLGADLQSRIEDEVERILTRWTNGVPPLERLKAQEMRHYSRTRGYYSPIGPVEWASTDLLEAGLFAHYRKDLDRMLARIRIVAMAASSCRHYREHGALPGREKWPEGVSIQPVSGAEWIVAESIPTGAQDARAAARTADPAGAEKSTALCWKDSDSCSGRLGLKVRCGSG